MRCQSSHQLSFGDEFIDPRLFKVDDELKHVDELLSEHALLNPIETVFDPSMGVREQPSTCASA
jgi:hypothetical protein